MKLEQLIDDIKAVVRDGEELLRGGAGGIKDKARVGAQSADRAIRGHPYESLAIFFGIGFLAGLIAVGTFSRQAEHEPAE